MKEGGDIFRRYKESFSKLNGHFHILEQPVPVEYQMKYFKFTEQVRKRRENQELDELDYETFYEGIYDPKSTTAYKRYLLSLLATSSQVRAFRILEEYVQHPDEDVSDWAYMAFMESRISIESELSGEKQIYISTGLGGKGEKLRFYVLMLSRNRSPFLNYQRKVIKREFAYSLHNSNCEIERLTIAEEYLELVLLIPILEDIKLILDNVINECNQYGNFLSNLFSITNAKEMTLEEVIDFIEKNENNKAGY